MKFKEIVGSYRTHKDNIVMIFNDQTYTCDHWDYGLYGKWDVKEDSDAVLYRVPDGLRWREACTVTNKKFIEIINNYLESILLGEDE